MTSDNVYIRCDRAIGTIGIVTYNYDKGDYVETWKKIEGTVTR